jgi:phosphoribosylformylglycinamidine (FGAM) synthase-like enzyme
MLTSVGRYTPTADMTGPELDKAKAMLLAQTRNARTSAERRQRDFTAFYKQVRPRLGGDRTVADALAELAAEKAA